MDLEERFEAALVAANPTSALRDVVSDLFSQGLDETAILDEFEKMRAKLRQAGRQEVEDTVMDVMDCLIGWCSPHMKLTRDQGKTTASTDLSESDRASHKRP